MPSAQSAQTAATATTAQSATTAQTATSATTAKTATSADEAATATNAENAKHADEAATATNATHATSADDAATIGGESAAELRAELKVTCASTTEFFGGMCWDKSARPSAPWIVAIEECAADGGRLPTIGELIAFVLRPGEQVTGQTCPVTWPTWSAPPKTS